eukprot:TRINITY_DN6857_c0_g1_i2.p1 TRINITY_DN6857_c0_g1~~TRINITY_DN6857_c0_g1_i2.p1  ORF type:complete len:800 (-),score=248.21 TRINITY_DN6857_c0_g1_i2:49-2448(-)
MSAGIDIGNKNCIIAVTQRGGVDIVTNEANFRQTPTLVAFSEKERDIGESASTKYIRNLQNTISQFKPILGRKFSEPEIQKYISSLPFAVKALDNDEIGVEVFYKTSKQTFSLTEIMGMLLRRLRRIAVAGTNNPGLRDVVVSVPVYYTSQQRQALLDATRIGGYSCLRLINETTATGLAYGFYRTDLPEKDPVNVMIVDVGDSATTASVMAFVKDKLKVLSHAFDSNLGGRDFDALIVDYFCKAFLTKYKLDIKSNARARVRLETACEKVKKVLSANTESPVAVECIMNDTDVQGLIKRPEFEELSTELLERIKTVILKSLESSGLKPEDISTVELVGGGSRVPSIGTLVSSVMGKPVSRTLNAEESCAKGCALQSAFLSPLKKTREYKIEEYNVFAIDVEWHDLDQPTQESTEIFAQGAVLPGLKVVTFPKGKPFELSAKYSAKTGLAGSLEHLGKWIVPEIPESSETAVEKGKVRVKVRVNIHGIFGVESAQMVETIKVAEPEKTDSTPPPPATTTTDKKEGDAEPAATPMETDKKESTSVFRRDLKIVASGISGMVESDLAKKIKEEDARVADDQEIIETAEFKNAVESYVYETKSALSYDWEDFVLSADSSSFQEKLDAARDWLYNEGQEAKRDDYKNKLNELKSIGDQIDRRRSEFFGRDEAVKSWNDSINFWSAEVHSNDPKYEHISEEDKSRVKDKITEVIDLIRPKLNALSKMKKTDDPVLTNSDIQHSKENLESFVRPIMNKPKPAPKKEEPKKEEPKKDEAKKEEETAGEKKEEAAKPEQKDAMDVDK